MGSPYIETLHDQLDDLLVEYYTLRDENALLKEHFICSVERLRALVKDAYVEGYKDGASDGSDDAVDELNPNEAWDECRANKKLQG